MKRVLFVLAGALLFAVAGFVLGSVATNWYADHFARSDDDINAAVLVALVAWPLLTLLGGYLGDLVLRRRLPGRGADRSG